MAKKTNRPSKDHAIFEEVKRIEGLEKEIQKMREYLMIKEFKKQNEFSTSNDFFESKKLVTKYIPKNLNLLDHTMDFDIQTITHAIYYLIEKYRLPEKYYKMLLYFLYDFKLTEEFYNSPDFRISHLNFSEEGIEEFNSKISVNSSFRNSEEYFHEIETIKGQAEEFANEENILYPIFIKISPFTKKEKFLKELRAVWKKKIEPLQNRYKQDYRWKTEKARGKNEEIEFVEDMVFDMYSKKKTVSEIREKVNDFYYHKYGEFEHSKTRDILNIIKRQKHKRG